MVSLRVLPEYPVVSIRTGQYNDVSHRAMIG